jgi:glycosyltransferase involved in cell wall biosynthesis
LPTYRRQEVLKKALEHIQNQTIDLQDLEVLIYDNGSTDDSRNIAEAFSQKLRLTYCLNEPGHGLGYSLSRGSAEASGEIVIELNDDALISSDFIERITEVFETDPKIGIIGVRAIEQEYESDSRPIGVIDVKTLEVVGNFDQPTSGPIDVEHVYGFCYAYRRELRRSGAVHDSVLLARDYSSGNRIETDQCLTARSLGYRVVYDGSIEVVHLAKPRPDFDERSLKWKLNHWRNTLYLFLKHFGLFGRNSIAIRFALQDVGALSLLRRPNKTNWMYFWVGTKARTSAVWHWAKFCWINKRMSQQTRTNQV